MSILDIVVLIFLACFGLYGFKQGLAKQLATFLTFLITVISIYYIYPIFLKYLSNTFSDLNKAVILTIGLSALVLFSIGLFVFLKQILSTGLSSSMSDNINKTWGCIFGILKGALVVIIILTIAMHFNEKGVKKKISKKSITGKWFTHRFYDHINKYMDLKFGIDDLTDRIDWADPIEIIE